MTTRKYLASYQKLAKKRGNMDPLQYLWGRYETLRTKHDERSRQQAQELALILLPYGHGKQAPRDKDNDTVKGGVFTLE